MLLAYQTEIYTTRHATNLTLLNQLLFTTDTTITLPIDFAYPAGPRWKDEIRLRKLDERCCPSSHAASL